MAPSSPAQTSQAFLAKGGRSRYQSAGPAAVAQPVEHRIRNAGVGGSNPFRGTIPSHLQPRSGPYAPLTSSASFLRA